MASAKNPFTLAHLAVFIVAILIVGSINENMSSSSNPKPDIVVSVLSKVAWREKVRTYWNPGGSIKVTSIANFKALMGEPSQIIVIE